jgi:hypothetical protein
MLSLEKNKEYTKVLYKDEEIGHILDRKTYYLARFNDWTLSDKLESEEIAKEKILEFFLNPPVEKEDTIEKPKRGRKPKVKD